MQRSLELAEEIVGGLIDRLSRLSGSELGSIFSVYVSGSYVRGDFLESNSDLDITVLFQPEAGKLFREDPCYRHIESEVQEIMGGRQFHSHTPGGVDWQPIRWDWLPTPQRGPSIPGPHPYYPPFGIFLFDLHQHIELCWGQDPRPRLADPPDPSSMARSWFERSLEKLSRDDSAERAASGAFKSLQLAQIIFGELTLDKRRLPKLYADFVPDFPMKEEGNLLIQEIVQARYPHDPPHFKTSSHYTQLVTQLWNMTQKKTGM